MRGCDRFVAALRLWRRVVIFHPSEADAVLVRAVASATMRNGDPSPIAKDVQRTDHGRLMHFQFGGDVRQRRPGVEGSAAAKRTDSHKPLWGRLHSRRESNVGSNSCARNISSPPKARDRQKTDQFICIALIVAGLLSSMQLGLPDLQLVAYRLENFALGLVGVIRVFERPWAWMKLTLVPIPSNDVSGQYRHLDT